MTRLDLTDRCMCHGEGVRVLRGCLSLYLCRDCGKPTSERPVRAGDAARRAEERR